MPLCDVVIAGGGAAGLSVRLSSVGAAAVCSFAMTDTRGTAPSGPRVHKSAFQAKRLSHSNFAEFSYRLRALQSWNAR